MKKSVLNELEKLTQVEREQQKNRFVSDDIPPEAIDLVSSHSDNIPVLNNYFFNNRSIYISKHNRFAPYPRHSHQFLEINYVLRGSVNETVAGDQLHLHEGDILLIDIGTSHSIEALDENDLLINILFRDQNISIDLLNQIQSTKSVLDDFLVNQTGQQKDHQKYLLFSDHHSQEVQQTIDQLIEEYYQKRYFSDAVIQASLTILIAKLARNYPIEEDKQTSPQQKIAIGMLKEIRNHYQNISLKELATKYAYNKNYIGSLFRNEVGKTFSDALTEERLLHARELIQTTRQPISSICLNVGLTNKSFFYHKYYDRFGHSPREDRQVVRNLLN